MKILVLVAATRQGPFPELVAAAKRTWASVEVDGVDVLFYYGGDRLALEGADLTLPVADDLPNLGRKTSACFAYVLEHREFDVVFRTNVSTYVDLPNLRRFVEENAVATRFYAGKGVNLDGIDFASGMGIFLSRDLVRLLAEEEWDHSYLDDVAIGKLLHEHGIERRFAPRVIYRRLRDARSVDVSQFQFRCKTAPTESASRAGDVEILLKIHDAFRQARHGEAAPRRTTLLRRRR